MPHIRRWGGNALAVLVDEADIRHGAGDGVGKGGVGRPARADGDGEGHVAVVVKVLHARYCDLHGCRRGALFLRERNLHWAADYSGATPEKHLTATGGVGRGEV